MMLMIKLARPMLRLLGRDDHGAYGVLVAVLISGGVLVGLGSLVVDVGQIYQNRAELQNGADAGALAVAKTCALGVCNTGTAAGFATANASALTGHSAAVDLVCGYSAAGGLGGCPASTGQITDCPASPAVGVNYVDVHTSTLTSRGSTLLPPVFARTLIGNKSYNGTTVSACAQAEWGPAQQADSLAVTLSYCDWQTLTSGSPSGTLIPVYLKGTKEKACSGPAGLNVPGGFGWLQPTTSSVCTAIIDLTSNTTYSDPGNNVTAACKAALQTYIDDYNAGNPVTVFLPIFDATSGSGNNAAYTIIGLAGFVITGYSRLPGGGGTNSYGPANKLCTAKYPCLEGYFKPGIDPVTSIGTGTNFGATAVKLTG